jgi:hypothetical protein
VSPTHGEFLCALSREKRVFVFVREEIWTGYDYYRAAKLAQKKAADQNLAPPTLPPLPKYVDDQTFAFLQEIKLLCPAPWIEQFKTVVDLKRRVLYRLMNELAALLHAQGGRITALVDILEKALPNIPPDLKNELLARIAKITGHDEQIRKLQEESTAARIALEAAQIFKVTW